MKSHHLAAVAEGELAAGMHEELDMPFSAPAADPGPSSVPSSEKGRAFRMPPTENPASRTHILNIHWYVFKYLCISCTLEHLPRALLPAWGISLVVRFDRLVLGMQGISALACRGNEVSAGLLTPCHLLVEKALVYAHVCPLEVG